MTQMQEPVSTETLFGMGLAIQSVTPFQHVTSYVPDRDVAYQFDPKTTEAILAGFVHNKRVLVQGFHGTGKSTHIEQVAARLNWPLVRINLDGQISRLDFLGRDVITLKDGMQVTELVPGILPWAIEHGVALVFDEYDAGRPEIMFILQRLLENNGKLVLIDQNRILEPHPHFRLFATANTLGLGDTLGLYHETNLLNQGQLDRWNIIVQLNYLELSQELKILQARFPSYQEGNNIELGASMIRYAGLTRTAFMAGDISAVMSPRTVLNWAENIEIFGSLKRGLELSFINRCEDLERSLLHEFYQRCFGEEWN
ncbi:Putative MoxR family aerobic cobaltochelatase subunit CobS [Candidatus Bealeia paramacronuclearis]|uniref:MoxR family aerobic cobaltochelatase subunit CobS n=1 Tax=Candidatus Bealeia paramacronuclearis TaxID=1921001 RepID=A0ABZ2C685_9PROT|nr:putative MoxR family aerobic cobaltochelatase subunit CobS [Candidatus Bealeia paramacronuclearis]